MTQALKEALLRVPPGPTGLATDPCQNYAIAVTAAPSAVTAVLPDGIPYLGCYVSWVSSVDCHIRVAVAANTGSATTSDWLLPAGVMVDWWHDASFKTHFSVIRAASAVADGSLKRARSNF